MRLIWTPCPRYVEKNETNIQTMEAIVATFPTQLAPYAVQLGGQLTTSFLRIVQGLDVDPGDDVDESVLDDHCNRTMGAIGIMKTISTLVISLDTSAALLGELEVVVMPVIVEVLSKDLLDMYDDAFEIIDSFTFCMKRVSPEMWTQVFPLIYRAFKTDAVEYLEEMLPSLDNFLNFGAGLFVGDTKCQWYIYDIAETLLMNETGEVGEADYVRACQLLASFVLNLQGHIDEVCGVSN
jgi:hypothetical protein